MIAVLGGGISGLAAAYQLQKKGQDFILLEADAELGGKIKSREVKGYTFELGPNTVLINNPEIKALIADLGLESEIILPDKEAVKNRFVLKNGKIEAIPNSLSTAWKSKLFQLSTFLKVLQEPLKAQKKNGEEESLADFARRRFGNQIYQDFITPFITGIYAGDPEKMSINHTLSILKEAEDKHGSVVKGMMKIIKEKKAQNEIHQLPKQKIFTFKKGLARLIEALSSAIGPKIETEAMVESIRQNGKRYEVYYKQEGEVKSIVVDRLISTLPAPSLSFLIKNMDENLGAELKKVNYVPAVITHFGFPKTAHQFQQKAFGILSRKEEQVPFLGLLFNSHFFPDHAPEQKELITVISGGYRQPDLINKEESKIIGEIQNSLRELIALSDQVDFTHVYKWPKAIPQFEMGHQAILDQIEKFETNHPNFYIRGNFTQGISVSDCIANSAKLVDKLYP
ncbi:MAG: protoporphyrinogen oxidase [Vicingaceae bacterium]